MSLNITAAGQYGYCDISAATINYNNENWSWCYWVKVGADVDYHGIAALNYDSSSPYTPSNRGLSLENYWLASSDTIREERNLSGTATVAPDTGTLSTNTWYGIAQAFQVSAPNTLKKSYFRTTASSTLTPVIDASEGQTDQVCNVVSVGTLANGTFNLDSGYISGFRIWKRTLNQTQLEAELNSPSVVDSTGLLLAWEFKNSGDLTADSSGNGRTVTFVGSPSYSSDEPVSSGTSVAPLAMGAYSRMRNG